MTNIETSELNQYEAQMRVKGVPEHLIPGLGLYLVKGITPGSFLESVLRNNLMGAFANGDEKSLAGLRGLVKFLYNDVPGCCWGNEENVTAWPAKMKELRGK